MSKTIALSAFIDGKVLRIFAPATSKHGNTYFTTPGGMYGVKVAGDAFPNGGATEFRVGTDLENSVVIPIARDSAAKNPNAFRGQVEIEVAGQSMLASAYLNPLPDGNVTIKVTARNKPKNAAKPALAGSDVLG